MASPTPKTITYFDAETGKEVEVSPQFLDTLKQFPAKTKVAATKWIAQGGAGVGDAEDDVEFVGDTFVTDKAGDDSLDDPVIDPLKQYNDFQGAFVGQPQTPELAAFLDAAGVGLDKIDEIQRSLQYRKNTNAWLRNRHISNSGSASATSALNPSLPQTPTSPMKLNKAAPGSGPNAPGASKNNSNVERLLPYAKKWAGTYGFPMSMAAAIINNESSFCPWVVNPAAKSLQGAYGAMQVTLWTAVSLGFTGYPHLAKNRSASSSECKVVGSSEALGLIYLPLEGAVLYENQNLNRQSWEAGAASGDNNMGRNPQLGADLIHPETNIMFGCRYLQLRLAQASSFGCFVRAPDGNLFAFDPVHAKEKNFEIVSPVGLTGDDAILWALQMYNASRNRMAYGEKAAKYMSSLEKSLAPEDLKPPTPKEREDAVSSFQQSTYGSGKIRQLKSFNVAFLNSLRNT